MNPRLTVSVLFILIAVTALRPEANDAFRKLKTLQHFWADKAPDRCAAEILNRIGSRVSALKSEFHGHKGMVTLIRAHGDRTVPARQSVPENQLCRVGILSPDGKTIISGFPNDADVSSSQERKTQHRVNDLIDSGRHTAAFERVTTALRQIHEVLDLMRTK